MTQLITLFLLPAGIIPYRVWVLSRDPSRPARWAVIGLYAAAIGYAGAVAYGFAFTDPTAVCGSTTLDNDFPLVSVTVDAFPPEVACETTDGHGPMRRTAPSAWIMWAGVAVAVGALSVLLLRRQSRVSSEVRAGAIWSPLLCAAFWVVGVDPVLELSRTDLHDECVRAKTIPPETKLIHIEVLDIDRTVFPPSITCTYPDGETDLLRISGTGVLLSGAASVVFAGAAVHQVRRAGRPGTGREEPAR
ncbi:hypothetical protein [Streptomyces sp. A012304]|uniref:hypothetical protein n=1 Tax=Streptomyces sp. A012304 TaxID=375446 RepID=UPI00222F7528|nr:hypothetical protein [Streptomyces sp. A012304]